MQQHYLNNMAKLCQKAAVLLFIMFVAFFFTACRNNTTCLPIEGGGNSGGGSPNALVINVQELAPVIKNVYEQLHWLHNQINVQGGPNRIYLITAHDINLHGLDEEVPGNNSVGIDFGLVNNVHVRIVGTPGERRTVELLGTGTMIYIGDTNTLTLYNVDLQGLAGNNNPLVDIGKGDLLIENSQIRDNVDGLGVRVTNGRFYMNSGAHVHSNAIGVELIGNTATLTITNAHVRHNTGRSGILVNGGTLTMNTGAYVRDNDGFGVEMHGSTAALTMANSQIRDNGWRGAVLYGGGIFTMNTGARIQGNQGGGVFLFGSHLVMNNNAIIYGNSATPAGNMVFASAATAGALPVIDGIDGHQYRAPGGGVAARETGSGASLVPSSIIMNGASRIENNEITGSTADAGFGGGGVGLNNSNLTMNDFSVIYNNTTHIRGGGGVNVRRVSTAILRDNARVERNHVQLSGGGITLSTGPGGRVFMYDNARVIGNSVYLSDSGGGAGIIVGAGQVLYMLGNDTEVSGNIGVFASGLPRDRSCQVRINHANSHLRMTGGRILRGSGTNESAIERRPNNYQNHPAWAPDNSTIVSPASIRYGSLTPGFTPHPLTGGFFTFEHGVLSPSGANAGFSNNIRIMSDVIVEDGVWLP